MLALIQAAFFIPQENADDPAASNPYPTHPFGGRRLLWLSVGLLWQDRLYEFSRAVFAHYDLILGLLVWPPALVDVGPFWK
jgi:hypothetical protein